MTISGTIDNTKVFSLYGKRIYLKNAKFVL